MTIVTSDVDFRIVLRLRVALVIAIVNDLRVVLAIEKTKPGKQFMIGVGR